MYTDEQKRISRNQKGEKPKCWFKRWLFSQQHCPGSADINHETAPSANSKGKQLCTGSSYNGVWLHTHYLTAQQENLVTTLSVLLQVMYLFHFSLLCKGEEFVKLTYFAQFPEHLPFHVHVLNHPAAGGSTIAIKPAASYFACFTSSCLL